MIQAIIFTIVAIWLVWGIVNVLRGLTQILGGVACGIAAVALYVLGTTLELIFAIFPNRKGSI